MHRMILAPSGLGRRWLFATVGPGQVVDLSHVGASAKVEAHCFLAEDVSRNSLRVSGFGRRVARYVDLSRWHWQAGLFSLLWRGEKTIAVVFRHRERFGTVASGRSGRCVPPRPRAPTFFSFSCLFHVSWIVAA